MPELLNTRPDRGVNSCQLLRTITEAADRLRERGNGRIRSPDVCLPVAKLDHLLYFLDEIRCA